MIKRLLLFVSLALTVVGCTTQTGGTASFNKDQSEKTFGARELHEETVTTSSHTDGTLTVTAKHIVLTSQPTVITENRNHAKTFQGSTEGPGDTKLTVKGGEAGILGDFSAVTIQKNAGNWILMLAALGCGALAYFVMKPPKNLIAAGCCVAVAILAMLAPTVLWLGAGVLILAVIVWWIATHGAALKKVAVTSTDSVTRIIEDHPEQEDSIKNSAARAQTANDPVISAAIEESKERAIRSKMQDVAKAAIVESTL